MVAATEPARSPKTGPRLVTPATAPILVIRAPPTWVQVRSGSELWAIATELAETRLLGTNARSANSTPVVVRAASLLSFMVTSRIWGKGGRATSANPSNRWWDTADPHACLVQPEPPRIQPLTSM